MEVLSLDQANEVFARKTGWREQRSKNRNGAIKQWVRDGEIYPRIYPPAFHNDDLSRVQRAALDEGVELSFSLKRGSIRVELSRFGKYDKTIRMDLRDVTIGEALVRALATYLTEYKYE